MKRRPDHLPDFRNPPLDEVYVGVQFNAVRGYQQIHSREVWNLFRADYPLVEEKPLLLPQFETFGLPGIAQINLISGAGTGRFWFLSETKEELIQFQQDRLLHNWRKVADQPEGQYPRFENMMSKFSNEILALQNYFVSNLSEDLTITQCEVGYINHIYGLDRLDPPIPGEWLRFVDFGSRNVDDFNFTFREIIFDAENRPQGRLICDAVSASNAQGEKLMALNLTARGTPPSPEVKSALDFLHTAREMVVKLFADITTDSAHKFWERTQ